MKRQSCDGFEDSVVRTDPMWRWVQLCLLYQFLLVMWVCFTFITSITAGDAELMLIHVSFPHVFFDL